MSEINRANTDGGLINAGSATAGRDLVGRDKYEIDLSSISASTLETILRGFLVPSHERIQGKEMLFRYHIEPTYQKLEQVHKDYENALLALRTQIRDDSLDTHGLLEWFEAKSIYYRSERVYLKNIDAEINALLGGMSNSKELEHLRKLISTFSATIISYFDVTDGRSLYNRVLFELRLINDAQTEGVGNLRDAKFALNRWTAEMLSHYLPTKWNAITLVYLQLRGTMLT